ncbi:MAG TPA: copper resistance protein CopC [Candidatus Cybelea sp.]|nr:copper resistance protein CopC [Candidatus Cybelea sp.]
MTSRSLLFATALLLGAAGPASAHAFLDHADPAVGSTVHGAPAEMHLWYTQDLEPAFTTVQVLDASGKQVDKGDQRVDASDKALLVISLQQLPPGVYKVIWRALSVDTHVTEGHFTFEVAP